MSLFEIFAFKNSSLMTVNPKNLERISKYGECLDKASSVLIEATRYTEKYPNYNVLKLQDVKPCNTKHSTPSRSLIIYKSPNQGYVQHVFSYKTITAIKPVEKYNKSLYKSIGNYIIDETEFNLLPRFIWKQFGMEKDDEIVLVKFVKKDTILETDIDVVSKEVHVYSIEDVLVLIKKKK